MRITYLGNSAARPYPGSPTTAVHLRAGGTRVLLDCGEGTLVQLEARGLSIGKLDAVCITHVHGDHLYGLPGLLTSMSLGGRTRGLTVAGPPAVQPYLESVFAYSRARLAFPLTHVATQAETPQRDLLRLRDLVVDTLPLRHRIPTTGFCVHTRALGRKIRPGVVEEHSIPYARIPDLRAGADYRAPDGTLHRNDALTLPGPRPLAVAYLTDTAALDDYPAEWPAPDLLAHDATFLGPDAALAAKTGHSTSTEAVAFGLAIGARRVRLMHRSARYATADADADVAAEGLDVRWPRPGETEDLSTGVTD